VSILLILTGLIFCGASVFCFYKANYCACTRAGQCDNPVNHFWLGAITCALISLTFCCLALGRNITNPQPINEIAMQQVQLYNKNASISRLQIPYNTMSYAKTISQKNTFSLTCKVAK